MLALPLHRQHPQGPLLEHLFSRPRPSRVIGARLSDFQEVLARVLHFGFGERELGLAVGPTLSRCLLEGSLGLVEYKPGLLRVCGVQLGCAQLLFDLSNLGKLVLDANSGKLVHFTR